MPLIIVESPTKARTFNRILKDKGDYFVFATQGHIRDLPNDKLAIDYQKNFQPEYVIIKNKEKIIEKLKELALKNKEIILATDLDREGESISYHIAYLLGKIEENWPEIKIKDKTLKRIVFHEITQKALDEALKNPQALRIPLVRAQQSRRILDRIVGYELSPLLWKKTGKNWLSAGRVQTVALRLIVEREKEIKNFKTDNYYQIYANFSLKEKDDFQIKAKLISKDNLEYEIKTTLNLFAGDYTFTKTTINDNNLKTIKEDLLTDKYKIFEIKEDIIKRYPPPPLTTSLLQQEAFYRFGFSSKMTMSLAQQLYEKGYITYHRTDSFNLSSYFVFKAKDYLKEKYGEKYALDTPRFYKTKSKSAQEAHEAIRPTKLKESLNTNDKLTVNHKKLYQLIFQRALASQMKEAEIKVIKIKIKSDKNYLFETNYEEVLFDGFLKVLAPNKKSQKLPEEIKVNQEINLLEVFEEKQQTKPPPRYNEASLIKVLEEKGIGRPSTYAPIISLIQTKNYVEKESRYFIPTNLGIAISDYLSKSFFNIFDLNFTAMMEDELDKIASNEKNFLDVLKEFFLPFKEKIEENKKDLSFLKIEEDSQGICPEDGGNLILRYSKFGKFLACSNYPKCKYTKSVQKTLKNKLCPKCGGEIVIRYSKNKKKFYGCLNYPKCDFSAWKQSDLKDKKTPI